MVVPVDNFTQNRTVGESPTLYPVFIFTSLNETTVLFVSISQVIGCEDRLRIDLNVSVRTRVCVSWVEIRATWWRRRTKGQVRVCVCVCAWSGKNTFSFRCHDATFYVRCTLSCIYMSYGFFTNWGAKHKKTLLTPCNRPAKGGWL